MERFLLVLAVLAACGRPRSEIGEAPSFEHVPRSRLPAFEIDTRELDEMIAQANASIATWHAGHGRGVPPEIVEAAPEMVALFQGPTLAHVERVPCTSNAVPIGEGWAVALRIGNQLNENAFVRRTPEGVRIYERRPAEIQARTRLKHVSGTAWVHASRGRMRLELRLVVESDDRFARLNAGLMGRTDCADPQLDYAIDSLEVEGGGRWTTFGSQLFVETRGPGIPTAVTIRLAEIMTDNRLYEWVPVPAPGRRYDVDLVLAVEDKGLLAAPGGVPVHAPAGWKARRLRGLHAIPAIVPAWVSDPQTTVTVRGANVQLVGDLAHCPDTVASIIKRVPALVPLHDLAIVETPGPVSQLHYVGNVITTSIGWGQRVCEHSPSATLALLHEIMHSLCPGEVPGDHLTAARISESLAQYLVLQAATPAELDSYPFEPDHAIYPVGLDARIEVPPLDDLMFSYLKGPLILNAIERRIGASTMRAVLLDFFKRRRDQVSSWADLATSIEIVAGPDAAADARRRFSDPAWPEERWQPVPAETK